jgi:sulfofructose kinase
VEIHVDVLCVGHASYDLVFAVDHHPQADEKTFAQQFISCGGGPAANAAVTVSRLGFKSAFAGYLGNDYFGQRNLEEFEKASVNTDLIARGDSPTPVSTIWVKPDGKRTLVNYKGSTRPLAASKLDFSRCRSKVVLFDGHEPDIVSSELIKIMQGGNIATVLDAGSVHRGTLKLLKLVDYTVASQKFSCEYTGKDDPEQAAVELSRYCPSVVITLGERGLVWKNIRGSGTLPAFSVAAVDTTGAGDAFHGAFAAGLAAGKSWRELLEYAAAVAALCCTKYGARPAIPSAEAVDEFLNKHQVSHK